MIFALMYHRHKLLDLIFTVPLTFFPVPSMICCFFNWCSGGGVKLGTLGTAATNRPIGPAQGDYDDGEIGGITGRGNRSTRRKTCPNATLSTQNPTCCPDANPGRRGGKPTTNRLSYGMASQ
jgi:hypothetical protein